MAHEKPSSIPPEYQPTGAEAYDHLTKGITSQFLTHWQVGHEIQAKEDARMREWLIELVRHLAIINGVGLAGVATLMTVAKLADTSKPSLIWAGAAFIFGLTLAVLDMYLNSLGHLNRMKEMHQRINELRTLYENSPISLLEKLRNNTIEAQYPDKCLFQFAATCGWGAAIGFFVGVFNVYKAIA